MQMFDQYWYGKIQNLIIINIHNPYIKSYIWIIFRNPSSAAHKSAGLGFHYGLANICNKAPIVLNYSTFIANR